HKAALARDPQALPPNEEHLAGLVYSLLQPCLREEKWYQLEACQPLPPPKSGPRSPYDLLLWQQGHAEGQELRLGVRFLATSNGNTTAAALRWLLEDENAPDRILLVTEERQPLSLGPEGRKRLEQLHQRGRARFQHLELSFERYAELDAFQAVVGMARAGDLELERRTGPRLALTEADVLASHRRKQ